jgi:hypothetical protein
MKHAKRFAAAVCLAMLSVSCAGSAGGPDKDVVPEHFMPRDAERLERFGGTYVPMGEGALATKTPVLSVHFNEQELDDRDFYDVFPGLQRMDPLTLSLDGHPITDRSIEYLNRLKSLKTLSLRNTKVTMAGLRKLNVKRLQSLHVSEEKFNEKDRAELEALMKRVGRTDV